EDLFGSTVNICTKINSMAEPNGIVIGGDLYQIIKSFSFIEEYQFREFREGYSVGLSRRYPIYATFSKNISSIDIRDINQLFRPTETSNIKGTQLHQQSQLLQQSQKKKKLQKCSANIMIVDDEPDTLFTYKSILSEEGYNVQGFTNSKEALTHFVQLADPSAYYHVVLLDIRMPRLNGLQLFSRIKAISPATKVMFASALDIEEELVSVLPNITHKDIMKKPMEREYLIQKISSALNSNMPHFGSLSA
ncbi:MAG: response regulator, partial [Thermoproteota archaeon]|nr:response regulator [Thermoproteota archaeon]